MSFDATNIRDEASGAEATIYPGLGFNCASWTVPVGGERLELLWSAPDFPSPSARPSGSGIPILFPFAGRIAGTQFEFQGRSYELQEGDGRGNAIHGFVLNRAWEVQEHTTNRVVGRFQASQQAPEVLSRWPADFCLVAEYTIDSAALRLTLKITNCSEQLLPCGLGLHPYFRLPLGGDSAEDQVVQVPAQSYWELANMLPTGRKLPLADRGALRTGMRFGDMQFDDVLGDLEFAGERCEAGISDRATRRRLAIEWDQNFPFCVVYNPPHREAICIEPYTTLPNPFKLAHDGVDSGLRLLQPGDRLETRVTLKFDQSGA